jgi:hydroxyacylglutathione hydrolase
LLSDSQIVYISNMRIQGISTPGHTPGSMCYLIEKKYLFVGDALSLKSGKADKFNEFFNMDTETQLKSIKKLSGLSGVDHIFTSHYGFSSDFSNVFKEWK